jgi:hypothetical protein
MSDVLGAGQAVAGAAGAAASIYVANRQYQVAKDYSNRAQQIHDETLKRLKSDVHLWEEHARGCLIKVISDDCAKQPETARYSEMTARAQVPVRLAMSEAKRKARECASIYCVGGVQASLNALAVQEAILLGEVTDTARRREEARVDVKNAAARQDRIQSIGIVRGNYKTSQGGMSALAGLYSQIGAQAGAAASGTIGAGAQLLGRYLTQRRDQPPQNITLQANGADQNYDETDRLLRRYPPAPNDMQALINDPNLDIADSAAQAAQVPSGSFDPTWEGYDN